MTPRQRLLAAGALTVVGLALFMISQRLRAPASPPTSAAEPVPYGRARPSPTWAPMPTRAVVESADAESEPDPSWSLRQALLVGDLASAQQIWDELQSTAATQVYEAQLAGARLALQLEDYETARARASQAIALAPKRVEGWAFLGVVLRRAGDAANADHALAVAKELDNSLGPDLFDERWRAAVALNSEERLLQLAEEYLIDQPESLVAPHYRGTALLASGEVLAAIDVLVKGLRERPAAPALVWYTLGEAYLAADAHAEAAVALEVAAGKVAQGDATLTYVTPDPITALNERLARAYLRTNRCAEAEDIFRRLLPAQPDLEPWIEEAVVCQTPTPTLTPWILPPVTLTPRSD